MESLIQAIVRALGTEGITMGQIHNACVAKGWKSDDIFLAIKAAENLYNAIQQQEQELRNKKPPFGRKLNP
jgi:hypothetical protein